MRKIYGTVLMLSAAVGINPVAVMSQGDSRHYAAMSEETLDSIYSRYGIPGTGLLRENYPFDSGYKAGYLAGDDGVQGNPYSYLWSFSGTLSAVSAIYEATSDKKWLQVLDERVMPGLEMYADEKRIPPAYASYVNTAAQSDRFYDDNIWLGIDFVDLYNSTKDAIWLHRAQKIWEFIECGTDDVLGGGIYWCEQKKGSKNTCSNAPGAVLALKLYGATSDKRYLEKGRRLYDWTKRNLQDPEDGLYFDNINLKGEIGRSKFAYNTGQMIEAAVLLYRHTGKKGYLREAERVAESGYRHFFNGGEGLDEKGSFRLLNPRDVWFSAVMMRGYAALERVNHNPVYMDAFCRNLDYVWRNMRDASTGLVDSDWSGTVKDEKKWLLTQAAYSEMLARAAYYRKSNNHQHQ